MIVVYYFPKLKELKISLKNNNTQWIFIKIDIRIKFYNNLILNMVIN